MFGLWRCQYYGPKVLDEIYTVGMAAAAYDDLDFSDPLQSA